MTLESLADILEQDLEDAFEVKNKKSLHRYITLLTENLVRTDRYEQEHSEFRETFLRIDSRIEEGFKRMDERFAFMDKRFEQVEKKFEQVDKRFEAVDLRFNRVTAFLTAGFAFLAVLITVFRFLG